MMYLFHNVYGDADELIDTKPDNVQAVPFGWTDEIEAARNELLTQLNCSVSALPSIVFEIPEKMIVVGVIVNGVMEESLARLPTHYEEIRISDMPKPWNWGDILPIIEDLKISTTPYPGQGEILKWDPTTEKWVPRIAVLP
jgi:hypothetical protein